MLRHSRQINDLTKMLTYILCHRPDEFGLVLAEDGSVAIKHLLQALAAEPGWSHVRRRHLEEVAALCQPPCFAIEGERLRSLEKPAQLRHSGGELPPPLLYLGISAKAHLRVWEEGLKAPAGQELVLASQRDLALKLGKRRTASPVLVIVQAQAAARRGVAFEGYGEGLFLAREVPREFLQLPAPPPAAEKPKPARPAAPQPLPGSIVLYLPHFFEPPQDLGEKDERARRFARRTAGKKTRGPKKGRGR